MIGTQLLVCPGGICTQSLLLGSTTSLPHAAPGASAACSFRCDRCPHGQRECRLHRVSREDIMLNMPAHFAQACLGVGALILRPASGAIVGGSIRTHVHNATISATIRTTVGVIKFSVFVHATRQLVVVQDLRGSGGEQTTQLLFDFVAAPALSPVLFEEHRREWLIFTLHWPSAAGMEWQARATRARSCRALPCSKCCYCPGTDDRSRSFRLCPLRGRTHDSRG